jgi:dihydrofolate synthase/folylpolyglutamate synthase
VGSAIAGGLTKVVWPGRLEHLVADGVQVVLDCAHNPHGAAALAVALRSEGIDPQRTALVFGALADKAWREVLEILAPLATRRYYAEPRGRSPATFQALRTVADGICVGEPRTAIRRALRESPPGDMVLVTGSIYLVGEVRGELLHINVDPVVAL